VARKIHNREEWKKLLRMARNHHILHMAMERMNEFSYTYVIRNNKIHTLYNNIIFRLGNGTISIDRTAYMDA